MNLIYDTAIRVTGKLHTLTQLTAKIVTFDYICTLNLASDSLEITGETALMAETIFII